jgi:HD-GYP domain-containing protein (c-di-GMP phosphodiesterase class II)
VSNEPQPRLVLRRPRILWIVLVTLLLVSLLPIGLYHQRVLQRSEEELARNERIHQSDITRLLAEEVHLYQSSLHQQLETQRQILALTGLVQNVEDPKRAPQVMRLLENFVAGNPNILYATAVGRNARGQSAGSFQADADPFIGKALQRAFATAIQNLDFHSDPLAYGAENRPAFVMAVPLFSGGTFSGMLASVVSLDATLARLKEYSVRGREVYVVDRDGRVVAHPDLRRVVPGTDLSAIPVVATFKEAGGELRTTETRPFDVHEEGRAAQMIGTISPVRDLHWAVIAQRRLDKAREDAQIDALNREARGFVLGVTIAGLVLGYLSAILITTPIRGLADSTRAISRGEFHERASVGGAAEIAELAETFNKMAGDIEQYVDQLKQAAEENRELFIGSIRMLAAAIDEKDPYTRGHSGRVAKYSLLIGEVLGLDAQELDRLRISALLHDVGKIGVDDRVLKKPGSLTPEEFELMKQHPVKGANIMRPVVQLKEMLPGIELHHECMDGRGYPYGLRGEQIPMMARIIAVADTLDAITTNRPYQQAQDLTFALDRIRQLAGGKFDPKVVDALEVAIQSGKLRLSAQLVEV